MAGITSGFTAAHAQPPARIAAIGDFGEAGDGALAVSALVHSLVPDAIITLGDNSYTEVDIDDNVGQYYADFIGSYVGTYGAGSVLGNRFFPSLGNHDYSDGGGLEAYLDYFELPGPNVVSSNTSGNERYYDFVVGPVHFFAINSNAPEPDGRSPTSAQGQWLQQQLASSTYPWKIVYFHHAAYSSGSKHGNNDYMQWPFKLWGASAVIAGHDHVYERLIVDEMPYFVNGIGGRSTRGFQKNPEPGSMARYNDDFGAMLLTAEDTRLTFEFYSINPADSLVDSYTLIRTAPDIAAAPWAIDYGSTYITDAEVQELALHNAGTSRLDITDIFVDGLDAAEFQISVPDESHDPRGSGPTVASATVALLPGATWRANVRLAPSSVGAKQAVIHVASNDPNESAIDIPLAAIVLPPPAPEIAVSADTLDYGDVQMPSSARRSLWVRNEGNKDLQLQAISIAGSHASEFALESGGGGHVVAPGDSVHVSVDCTPVTQGAKTASLQLASDDGDEPLLVVPLLAEAVPPAPDIDVQPSAHDFGSLMATTSVSRSTWVRNTGFVNLEVTSITLLGPDASEFALTTGGVPISLAFGDSTEVVVTLAPLSEGPKAATLRIGSNDPDENPVEVALSGFAMPPPIPDIDVSATALDYGGLVVGVSSATQMLQLRNLGTGDLHLGNVAILGADAVEFELTLGPSHSILVPGDSVVIHVMFDPGSIGPKSAILRIPSDDPDEDPWDVALSGVGIDPAGTRSMVTFQESVIGESSGGTSVGTAGSITAVEGHVYIAAITSKSFRTVVGVSGLGLTWVPVVEQCSARDQTGVSLWMATGSPTPGSVTASFEGSIDSAVLIVSRYSGADPQTPLGNWVSGNTNGESGSCTGGVDTEAYTFNMETQTPDALVFGAVAKRNRTLDPGAGYALRDERTAGNGGHLSSLATLDQEFAQAGTVTFDGSFNRDVDWAVAAFEIRSTVYFTEISITPTSHDFGAVAVSQSATTSFEIRNDGDAELQLPAVSVHGAHAGEFTITGGHAPATVAPAATHTVIVAFAPQSVGSKNAVLRVVSNDADEVTTDIALTGSAYALEPEMGHAPESLAFGDVTIGSSATLAVRVWNTGNGNLDVLSSLVGGTHPLDFAVSAGAAPFVVPPGDSVDVELTFSPAAEGLRNALLQLLTNDAGQPNVQVTLTGNGLPAPVPGIGVAPAAHDFGDVMVSASASVLVRLWNDGNAPLVVGSTTMAGPDSLSFAVSDGGAPLTLAAGDSADVTVEFVPTTSGSKAAQLAIGSNDPDEPSVSVGLAGNALPLPLPDIAVLPTAHDFGSIPTLSSMTFNIVVRNEGTDSLDVFGTTVTGADSLEFAITNGAAPFTLVPGDSSEVSVTFTPSTDGAKSATLQVQSNDPDQPIIQIALNGTGVTPSPGMVVFEESASGSVSGAASVSTDATLAAVEDNLYVAAIATKGYRAVTGVSGMGLTWTLVQAQCGARQQTGVEVWMGAGTPSPGLVTATLEVAPSKAVIIVSRYSGADLSAPFGATVSANTNGVDGNCSGGVDNGSFALNLQTTTSNALVYMAVAMRHRFLTPGNGYTLRDETRIGSAGTVASVAILDQEFITPGLVGIDGTFNGDVDWAVAGIEIIPAPVAAKQTEQATPPVRRAGLALRNGVGGIDPWIELASPDAQPANVRIYDVRGRLVDAVWNGPMPAGRTRLNWSGVDRFGRTLAAGIYLVRADIGPRVFTGKLVILR